MKRVMIDTCVYSELLRGNSQVAEKLNKSDLIMVNPIILGELYDGFRGGMRESENRDVLGRFMSKPRTALVPITDSTSEWFAEIKEILRRKGKPIPINDVWIAASCMEHGAFMLTLDTHFSYIDGLLLAAL